MTRPFRILGEAFINMWRNKTTTFFSIVSVSASLLILGLVFAIILNINSIAMSAGEQFDTITIYIKDEAKPDEIQDLVYEIDAIEGVESTMYISKDNALNVLKERWGENGYLLEDLETNPLPRTLIVTLNNISYAKNVQGFIEGKSPIEEIKTYNDVLTKLMAITSWLRKSGTILIFILIGVSTILIHNAIRLAVESRENEIMIMKYIGATNWYIRWPFVIEGMIIGLIGASIAFGLVHLGYSYLYAMIQKSFFAIVSSYIVLPYYIIKDLVFLFIVIGVSIGALGSIISTRRSLNV